jgi:5'-3' exonuclease
MVQTKQQGYYKVRTGIFQTNQENAHPVVVFDGYSLGPSTKDHTHSRRTKGIEGTKIEFRKNTPFSC